MGCPVVLGKKQLIFIWCFPLTSKTLPPLTAMGLFAPELAVCRMGLWLPRISCSLWGNSRVNQLISWSLGLCYPSVYAALFDCPYVLVSEWVLCDHAYVSIREHRVPAFLSMYC